MWNRRRLGVLVAIVGALFASCGTEQATDSTSGSQLTFTATAVDGSQFDAADLEGEPSVFWFWAPWCSTCAAEAPYVLDLAEEYGDAVHVVGVASLGQPSEMKVFIDRTGTSAIPHLNDEDGAVWRHFGITAQSTFALVDSSGAVTYSGYLEPDDLAARVADLAG